MAQAARIAGYSISAAADAACCALTRPLVCRPVDQPAGRPAPDKPVQLLSVCPCRALARSSQASFVVCRPPSRLGGLFSAPGPIVTAASVNQLVAAASLSAGHCATDIRLARILAARPEKSALSARRLDDASAAGRGLPSRRSLARSPNLRQTQKSAKVYTDSVATRKRALARTQSLAPARPPARLPADGSAS